MTSAVAFVAELLATNVRVKASNSPTDSTRCSSVPSDHKADSVGLSRCQKALKADSPPEREYMPEMLGETSKQTGSRPASVETPSVCWFSVVSQWRTLISEEVRLGRLFTMLGGVICRKRLFRRRFCDRLSKPRVDKHMWLITGFGVMEAGRAAARRP